MADHLGSVLLLVFASWVNNPDARLASSLR
jgi:hypothetical protein